MWMLREADFIELSSSMIHMGSPPRRTSGVSHTAYDFWQIVHLFGCQGFFYRRLEAGMGFCFYHAQRNAEVHARGRDWRGTFDTLVGNKVVACCEWG